MRNADSINALNEKYPQLKKVSKSSTLEKVKQIETEHSDSNFVLLKRFLLELQMHNNTFLRNYNREVI